MIKFPTPKPDDDDNVHAMLGAAYYAAEEYYLKHFIPHERIDYDDDWDETTFITYARLWLVMLATWDHMHGQMSIIEQPVTGDTLMLSYTRSLKRAYTADLDECLVAMYG